MSMPDIERLRSIKTFPSLVKYLRDELDWPIESDDFEEITFDYAPEELGLDAETAVKIKEVRQLRPLTTNQPWGIFFVNFEPKRMPVVVLRRILRSLVVKKRQSANKAQQAAWKLHDLLFISSYGESDHRDITFAHFAEESGLGDLPTLRVLGWDDEDTALHLEHTDRELREKLRWPSDDKDLEEWRRHWSAAFTLRYKEVISTSKELAEHLAALAIKIRKRANAVLRVESEKGPFRKLYAAFREALVHDLKEDDFADMYAQTISYGLLTARVSRPEGLVAENLRDMVPVTNPFLKELLETFLTVGGRKGKIDFDELGVSEVVQMLRDAKMKEILLDFGDRNPQEDPAIHFYELFLKEYDPQKRMKRGVFYTPRPIVSFIVRSVDGILRKEFGLPDGLADTTTWGEMVKSHPDLKIPDSVSPKESFLQILDPATGTGTFLVEVIDVIHKTMIARWRKEGHMALEFQNLWNEYVPKHLLPRLYGFELMMAPYAIAHMKIGLKLAETGYRFQTHERARIYLTNTLEPPQDFSDHLAFDAPALAHEAQAVNAIKRHQCFTVVVGNPPYSVTSANFNEFIDSLMNDYKKHVRGEQGLVALADDYLKFVRLSQYLLRKTGYGLWGMITNHGYLKGVIHRGVRKELMNQFDSLFILDLHGDSNIGELTPSGRANDNVFDIQQGVAISIGARFVNRSAESAVLYGEVWGTRSEKYNELSRTPALEQKWTGLHPSEPNCFLVPFDDANLAEYKEFPSIDELMPVNSCGVKTHRDGLVIDFDKNRLTLRMKDVASEHRLELLRERYGIHDTPHWKLRDAQRKMEEADVPRLVRRITYRPFDNRWIYYNPSIIEKGDSKYPTLRHMFKKNLALLTARLQATGVFDAVFVSQFLVEMKTAESSRSCTVFPLFLSFSDDTAQTDFSAERRANLEPEILRLFAQKLGLEQKEESGLPDGINPEDILYYAYAVLHSPAYRNRYAPFLKIDFPRLPFTGQLKLFRALTQIGCQLVSLHLLESPKLDHVLTKFIGTSKRAVEKIAYANQTVWIDKACTCGFRGVPEAVWDFHIGGYQVCEKWLKDRKGQVLLNADVEHYHRIVVSLAETILLMAEIDKVIEAHGGWPGAFITSKN